MESTLFVNLFLHAINRARVYRRAVSDYDYDVARSTDIFIKSRLSKSMELYRDTYVLLQNRRSFMRIFCISAHATSVIYIIIYKYVDIKLIEIHIKVTQTQVGIRMNFLEIIMIRSAERYCIRKN